MLVLNEYLTKSNLPKYLVYSYWYMCVFHVISCGIDQSCALKFFYSHNIQNVVRVISHICTFARV